MRIDARAAPHTSPRVAPLQVTPALAKVIAKHPAAVTVQQLINAIARDAGRAQVTLAQRFQELGLNLEALVKHRGARLPRPAATSQPTAWAPGASSAAASARLQREHAVLEQSLFKLTDELLQHDPAFLKGLREEAAVIRHLPTEEAKIAALTKSYRTLFAQLQAPDRHLPPDVQSCVASFRSQLEDALANGTIVAKDREVNEAYAEAARTSLGRAIATFTADLAKTNPALLNAVSQELNRLASLPRDDQQTLKSGFTELVARVNEHATLSQAGKEAWDRVQSQIGLSTSHSLSNLADFADQAFDRAVEGLLNTPGTGPVLDARRPLPESKEQYLAVSKQIHQALGITGHSTALTSHQIDQAFALAGKAFGLRPEFLKYMAKTESGLKQTADNGAAFGLMQIERVHRGAYEGAITVKNDTITNIVYGALLRAQTDRTMALRFEQAGLVPPNHPRVIEFLGDLAYNRGPGVLKYFAQGAAEQKIDVNNFGEYLGGRGGSFKLLDGGKRIRVVPGPGTHIDETGQGSVVAKASDAVGRVRFSAKLAKSLGDRNGDGRVDHLDVWLTRGVRYLKEVGS